MATEFSFLAPVVRKADNAIHRINEIWRIFRLLLNREGRGRLVKITQFNMATLNRVLASQPSVSFFVFNKTVHFPWIITMTSHDFYLFFNFYGLFFFILPMALFLCSFAYAVVFH